MVIWDTLKIEKNQQIKFDIQINNYFKFASWMSTDIKGTGLALHINSGIVFSLALSPDNEQHQIPFLIQNWTNPWLSSKVDQMWEKQSASRKGDEKRSSFCAGMNGKVRAKWTTWGINTTF